MAELRIKNLPSIAPEQITDEVYLGTDNIESLKITFSQIKAYILNNLMALSVGLDTDEFSKNLDSAIDTVQALAEWIDQADFGGGGGSGDILSTLATVAELEKQGIKIALPNPDCMVESFTNIQGEVSIYSDYTGGSTIVLKKKVGLMKGYVMPYIISDKNGLNEIIFISELVSGSSGAWAYNIAKALNNNYTVANESKITNYFGNVSGNQLVPSNGNTSAMFIKTLLLSKMKDGTVEANINFNTNIYPADVSILNTNVLKFSSSVDVKDNFKDNDYVVIFKKSPEEDDNTVVLSSQNPQGTGTYSWFIVQLDADTTYSSPNITASFDLILDPETGAFDSGYPDVGDDETGYYAMRLTAFLDCIVGGKEETTIQRLWPKELIIGDVFIQRYHDDFTTNRGYTNVGNVGYSYDHASGFMVSTISGNSTSGACLYKTLPFVFNPAHIKVRGLFYTYNTTGGIGGVNAFVGFGYRYTGMDNINGIVVGNLRSLEGHSRLAIYYNGVMTVDVGIPYVGDKTFYYIELLTNGKIIEGRLWQPPQDRPALPTVTATLPNPIVVPYPDTVGFQLSARKDNGVIYVVRNYDFLVENDISDYRLKYSLPATGIEKVSLIGKTVGENNQILSCNGAVV